MFYFTGQSIEVKSERYNLFIDETYNIKDMCMTNKGYDNVSEIVLNVMGFNDWLGKTKRL